MFRDRPKTDPGERGWAQMRLKDVVRRIRGGATPRSNEPAFWGGGIGWVTAVDIDGFSAITSTKRTLSDTGLASCAAEVFPSGAVIVTSRAPVGKVAITTIPVATSQGCKAIEVEPRRVLASFLAEMLRAMESEIQSHATGTTFTELSTDEFARLKLTVPPIEEQAAIVKYLGHAHARIDRAIAAKRKLIALLEEQKQAIIHQAVTRGLDPSVPLKESGIPWLGEIPAHWQTRRLKHLLREVDERSVTGDEEQLSVSHISGVTPRKSGVTMFKAESYIGHKICRPGDFVANTMWLWMGAVGVSPTKGIVSPSYAVYRGIVPTLIESTFLELLLRDPRCVSYFNALSKGIRKSRLRLYPEQFLAIPVPVPPIEEQRQIVAAIEHSTTSEVDLQTRVQREIELLREFRARLTSDVVTGQVDVREIAATLPELADEPPAGLDDNLDEVIEDEFELAGADG